MRIVYASMPPRLLAGVSWPFRIESQGLPAPAKGREVIRSALIILLKTNAGSRVRRPTLGTNLQRLLFETQGPILQSLIRREILTTVNDFLPQVTIDSILFDENENLLRVNIVYSIQGVQDETGFIEFEGRG